MRSRTGRRSDATGFVAAKRSFAYLVKITPVEIQHKEFAKTFRGYDVEEVRKFLTEMANAVEKLLSERNLLQEEIDVSKKRLSEYHSIEETLQNTLIIAQKTADEVGASANKKAELIISAANMEAEKIKESYKQLKVLKEELEIEIESTLLAFLEKLKREKHKNSEITDDL